TQGTGLPPVTSKQMLDIDTIAQYIIHHGRLGSSNAIHSVAMIFAMQVDHHSMFGYSLGHALGPCPLAACSDFTRVYGCMVALPSYCHDAIDTWNVSYPNKPFVKCLGDALTIWPFNDKMVPDLTPDGLIDHLISHGIPSSWIDHAYTYDLHHLNHHSHLQPGPFQELYCCTDCECLKWLDCLRTPSAIPQWDDWWSPSYHDITQIQHLLHLDDEGHGKLCFQDFKWLPAGTPAIF
ncbi:hypothetical protein L208DRAFT_1311536, partial [Tricholoma matsutake]